MKKITLFVGLFFFFAMGTALAQDKKGVLEGSDTSPVLTFEKLEFDFGTVKKGSDMKHDFTFKNTGKTPLILSNVKASCGCTTPAWPKEPIAPGKANAIKVTYDSNRVGPFTKSITVTSNSKNANVELIIKGTVTE